jgi:methenyltetrahydrofolate cyclohydrolase
VAERARSAQRAWGALLDDVAARTAAPGGGSGSAWAGALAAALTQMAASFATGARMAEIAERAAVLRAEMQALGDTELTAFEPVLEALRLPLDDPSRARRIAAASSAAADSPIEIARAAAELAELASEVARAGNPNLIGDAQAGGLLAEAVCQSAVRLARINLAAAPADDPRLAEAGELVRRAAVARVV